MSDILNRKSPLVPMEDVARFIRQLSHDLRNHLNAAELQAAFLGEVAADAETKDEVKRLRAMLGHFGDNLQQVTAALADIKLIAMPYGAADFMEDLQQKLTAERPEESAAIEWKVNVGAATLQIDPQILQPAFLELFANAFTHTRGSGPLQASMEADGNHATFVLEEPKSDFAGTTEAWGQRPFTSIKHGHYGLGLPRVFRIIEAHGGEIRAEYDAARSVLRTTVVLPLSRES